ncbi:unannotated protein [freshwater metagenome]|uniref:Unannotated protein n=1 Tax=freshwater metagenome TaxID=449393 RepID=A0A6J7LFM6_9ZZZZ
MRASAADDVDLVFDDEVDDIVSFESSEEPRARRTGVEAIHRCAESGNMERREHHESDGRRSFRWSSTGHEHAASAKEILQSCVMDNASV